MKQSGLPSGFDQDSTAVAWQTFVAAAASDLLSERVDVRPPIAALVPNTAVKV